MGNVIGLNKLNEVYYRIQTDDDILSEMCEHFTFFVPGYRFMPAFKNHQWDGKLRLVDRRQKTIYCGLIDEIQKFAEDREYTVIHEDSIPHMAHRDELVAFVDSLKIPFPIRDYQLECFIKGVLNERQLFLSPTASGKSFLLYALTRYWLSNRKDSSKKALMILPTVNLVRQMTGDFESYAKDDPTFITEDNIHQIYSGQEKQTDKPISFSTWQSVFRLDKGYFSQFNLVISDECHLARSESIKTVLGNCTKARYRYGTTGTLDGSKTNALVIQGLTGPIYQATTTADLMEQHTVAKLSIRCLTLKYSEEECKACKKLSYSDEIGFIISHSKRNAYIKNLALALEGNTLLLFQFVSKHGKVLHELIKDKTDGTNRKVFFIHGGTDIEDRELVRKITEEETNAIIVASVALFSTGVNIKNLDNVIFASPSKSRIRTLQSIGRVLRIGRSDQATLYDISDDLSVMSKNGKKHCNFGIKHLIERLKIYDSEKLPYTLHTIELPPSEQKLP